MSSEGENPPPGAPGIQTVTPGVHGQKNDDVQSEASSKGCGQSLCCHGTEKSPDPNQQGTSDQVTDVAPKATNLGMLQYVPTPDLRITEKTDSQPTRVVELASPPNPEASPNDKTIDLPSQAVQESCGDSSATTDNSKVALESVQVVSSEPEQEKCVGDDDVPDLIPSDPSEEPVASPIVSSVIETQPTSTVASRKEEELLWAPLTAEVVEPSLLMKMEKQKESNRFLEQLMSESAALLKDSADLFEEEDGQSDLYESDHEEAEDEDLEAVTDETGKEAEEEVKEEEGRVIPPAEEGTHGTEGVGEPEKVMDPQTTETTTEATTEDTDAGEEKSPEVTVICEKETERENVKEEIEEATETSNDELTHEIQDQKPYVDVPKSRNEDEKIPGPPSDIPEFAPVTETDTEVVSQQPEASPKLDPNSQEEGDTDPKTNEQLSTKISTFSNVLSDGYKILQKIGYTPKVAKESGESLSVENKDKSSSKDESKTDKEKKDDLGETNDKDKNPTEILEKSSFVVSDSVTDALNESLALLKRFGVKKDTAPSEPKQKQASETSPNISREKAVVFNDNLYKNYNLMLKLQRDVAKLQIHLSNMKDCVRNIDKDLEELMDASMEEGP